MAEWAAHEYGWTYTDIMWSIPASAIALFRRQSRLASGDDKVMHLSEIEEIDEGLLNGKENPDSGLR